jgi:hypothetical protein
MQSYFQNFGAEFFQIIHERVVDSIEKIDHEKRRRFLLNDGEKKKAIALYMYLSRGARQSEQNRHDQQRAKEREEKPQLKYARAKIRIKRQRKHEKKNPTGKSDFSAKLVARVRQSSETKRNEQRSTPYSAYNKPADLQRNVDQHRLSAKRRSDWRL